MPTVDVELDYMVQMVLQPGRWVGLWIVWGFNFCSFDPLAKSNI